jgi:hypothetical protein
VPIDLQSAVVVEAARKAFNLRGGSSSLLDETIVPVTQVRSLDDAPWRIDGVQVLVGGTSPAGVGNLSSVQFQHNTPDGSPSRVVIETLIISNPAAAAATITMGWRLALIGALRNGFTGEIQPGGPNLFPENISQTQFQVAVTNAAATQVSTAQCDVSIGANQTLIIPVTICLNPQISWVVENQTANAALVATASARVYRGY